MSLSSTHRRLYRNVCIFPESVDPLCCGHSPRCESHTVWLRWKLSEWMLTAFSSRCPFLWGIEINVSRDLVHVWRSRVCSRFCGYSKKNRQQFLTAALKLMWCLLTLACAWKDYLLSYYGIVFDVFTSRFKHGALRPSSLPSPFPCIHDKITCGARVKLSIVELRAWTKTKRAAEKILHVNNE